MVEPKLFKTKLCVLYQKGRCTRQNCNFAHGDAELRRFSGSFRGKRDYGGRDLSDRLDRRRSPQRKYSPSQDARGRDKFHECSPSKSLDKESDRKRRKTHHEDGQSNIPGILRVSNGVEDFAKEGKIANDSRVVLTEQLKKVWSEVNRLDHRRSQLTVCLEEKMQEVDSMSSKIQELEAHLYGEKEENKRITMKINKFVKTHRHHLRIQDQLKRSHSRLQKLGDELGSDFSKIAGSGEDLSIDIVSNGETTGYLYSPCNKLQNVVTGDLTKGHTAAPLRLRKLSHWNISANINVDKEIEAVNRRNDQPRSLANEGKHERRKTTSIFSLDKSKSLEPGPLLPSTSMASHVVEDDEDAEIELEDNIGVAENPSRVEKGTTNGTRTLPFPVPLSIPSPLPIFKNNYSQYEGEDGHVDVDDSEEMVQIDSSQL